MTYLQDLTPCTYGRYSKYAPLVAVGWLDPPFDFPRGTVKRGMRHRLHAIFRDPWLLTSYMGSHTCGFCAQAAGFEPSGRGRRGLPGGACEVLIPGQDVVYVVPELILHYIDEHQYCPPSPFVHAVEGCPPMGSRRYFLALMAVGGDMPAIVELAESDAAAARHAVLLWRNPLARAWYLRVRSRANVPRLLTEPLLEEWAAMRAAEDARKFPRQRVVDFLLRVSNAGHAVHEQGDEFVLPHPDGEIRVCPGSTCNWVVRRKRGDVWYPHGAAVNEAELERFLSSARGSPIL